MTGIFRQSLQYGLQKAGTKVNFMAKTKNSNKFINTIDECLTNGVKNGIFQVSLEDDSFNGREVTIAGQRVVNFGSCSYLGLEVDDRLKEGALDATRRFGTQYSLSR